MLNTTDSIINWPRIWPLVAPMAFLMPISRVLSLTVANIIFMIPMPPTMNDINATPAMNRVIW
jgi:hypothetical protein